MSDYNNENIFSKRLRAGKRRTYFFDVRTTKNNDYFVTLTESKKRYDGDGYDRHKIFLYKEDFNKFMDALSETINHVKTELMPDFDFDSFNHEDYEENQNAPASSAPAPAAEPIQANTEPAVEEVAQEIANTPIEESNHVESESSENPSASDEAQTW
jgi:hypothetical protein